MLNLPFVRCVLSLLCILVNLHSIIITYTKYRGMLIVNLYYDLCLGTPSLGNSVGLVYENVLQV